MDEQKQVEEIAKDFERVHTDTFITPNYYKNIATKFYNLKYRKLQENTVVLTKEEYEQLAIEYKRWEKLAIEDMLMQARKETVVKIFDALYQWLDLENTEKCGFATIQKFDFLSKFRELYQQLGIEIKE